MTVAGVLSVGGFAGCADGPPAATPMRDGPAVAAPAGWVDYCRRHATDDPRCQPSN